MCTIILYFIVLFKKGVKCDFPCYASPFFILRGLRGLKDVSLESAFIGRDVRISSGCSFFDKPFIFGKVVIGRYTSICGPATRIFAKINEIRIGSFCSIASNVIIQEYNHRIDTVSTYDVLAHLSGEDNLAITTTSKGPIVIEDGVWIGSSAIVLSGVTIGRGAIIGAGAVVVNDIPPYAIAVGNPAKIIKYRFSEESIKKIEDSKWWTWDETTLLSHKDFFKQILK